MNVDLLRETVQAAGHEAQLVEGGTELLLACPLCFDERSRMYISTETGQWICFHCNQDGALFRFLREVCDLKASSAGELADAIRGGRSTAPAEPTPRTVRSDAPAPVVLPKDFRCLTPTHEIPWEYCSVERGISPELISRYIGVTYSGVTSGRVVVPVYTKCQLMTWVARTWVSNVQPKVLYPSGSRTGSALFLYDDMIDRIMSRDWSGKLHPDPGLVFVEGVFDALRLLTLSPDLCVVSTLGAHITPEQMLLLKQSNYNHVILMRDNDAAGQQATVKEVLALKHEGLQASVAVLPEGTDPGELDTKTLVGVMKNLKVTTKDIHSEQGLKEDIYGSGN